MLFFDKHRYFEEIGIIYLTMPVVMITGAFIRDHSLELIHAQEKRTV
jgi:hypothetical protein